MSQLLGAIHRVGVFTFQEQNLFVYDDSLVLARGNEALLAFGLIGQRIARAHIHSGTTLAPEALAARNASNRLWRVADIRQARFCRFALNPFRRLELTLVSGETEVLKWQHGENKDKRVLPILQHALQGKLLQ